MANQFSSYTFLLTAPCKSRRDEGILVAPLPRGKKTNAAAFNLLPDHLKQLFNCLLPASSSFPLKAFSIICWRCADGTCASCVRPSTPDGRIQGQELWAPMMSPFHFSAVKGVGAIVRRGEQLSKVSREVGSMVGP